MSRGKHPIHIYFRRKRGPQGQKQIYCPYCEWTASRNATRQMDHLQFVCNKVSDEIKSKITALRKIRERGKQTKLNFNQGRKRVLVDDSTSSSSDSDEEAVNRGASTSGTQSSSKKVRPNSVESFFDKMGNEEQVRLSKLFANAVYGTGVSFHLFEHPLWKEVFSQIRPAFKVPSAYQLGNTLLDSQYKEMSIKVEEKIAAAPSLAIGIDGWTNIRRDSLMNIILFTPDPVFINSVDCGSESHTGEFIANLVEDVVTERGPDRFSGYISDNAANMKLSGEIIERKFENIIWYGCSMHALNLLLEDLSKEIASVKFVLDSCSEITQEILSKPRLYPIFQAKQKMIKKNSSITLKIPGKTRFGSNYSCVKAVLANQGALRALCIDPQMTKKVGNRTESLIKQEIKNIILSDDLWYQIEIVIDLLSPVNEALFQVQSDKATISQVVVSFKKIELGIDKALKEPSIFTAEERALMKQIFIDRKAFCLKSVHLAAAFLDPTICTSEYLSNEENNDAIMFIDTLACALPDIDKNTVSEECISFSTKSGVFSSPHFWRKTSLAPHLWWAGKCKGTELFRIAGRILILPATAAAVERSFSSHARIHSKVRNRLGNEKAGKLVYLYENFKILNKNDEIAQKQYLMESLLSDEESNLMKESVMEPPNVSSTSQILSLGLESDDEEIIDLPPSSPPGHFNVEDDNVEYYYEPPF